MVALELQEYNTTLTWTYADVTQFDERQVDRLMTTEDHM